MAPAPAALALAALAPAVCSRPLYILLAPRGAVCRATLADASTWLFGCLLLLLRRLLPRRLRRARAWQARPRRPDPRGAGATAWAVARLRTAGRSRSPETTRRAVSESFLSPLAISKKTREGRRETALFCHLLVFLGSGSFFSEPPSFDFVRPAKGGFHSDRTRALVLWLLPHARAAPQDGGPTATRRTSPRSSR